jgi:hypothetical protein
MKIKEEVGLFQPNKICYDKDYKNKDKKVKRRNLIPPLSRFRQKP